MPAEKGTKNAVNCAKSDGAKNQSSLLPNDILADLQELRTGDPYRNLNPLAWVAALQPS